MILPSCKNVVFSDFKNYNIHCIKNSGETSSDIYQKKTKPPVGIRQWVEDVSNEEGGDGIHTNKLQLHIT
jgi:hypothetical protein